MSTINCTSSVQARIAVAVALIVFLAAGLSVSQAADLYAVGMALNERLMAAELYDYALLNAEQMSTRFPERSDEIKIVKAEILHKQGKREQAAALLAQIPDDSPLRFEAMRVKALLAARNGKAEEAITLFNAYFKNVEAPPQQNRRKRSDYIDTLRTFAGLLMREKDPRAAEVVQKMQQLRQGGEATRESQYLQAKISLDAQPEEKANPAAVKKTLEELEQLKYGDDVISAYSYVQRIRAYLMLDRLDDALRLIRSSKSYLAKFDRALRQQGRAESSPMAGFFYYWARALRAQALAAREQNQPAKAQELLIAAAKRCRAVTQKYPNAEEYPTKAAIEFDRIRQILKNDFGIDITTSDGGQNKQLLESKLEEGDAHLQSGDYAKAAKALLAGIKAAPSEELVPQAGVRLAVCYAQLDKMLQAQAVALYLKDLFPNSPETVDALLKVGSVLYNKGKNAAEENSDQAAAMRIWGQFLALDPTHPKGQDIAFAIAEHRYGKAKEVAQESRDIDNPEQKKAAQQEAFELYREAIPHYEFLLDNYGSQRRGVRALYKLGWIHYTLEEYERAIEYFRKYSLTETQLAYGDDVIEAKFRVGEILLQELNDPMLALEQFEELLDWLAEDREGINPRSKNARQRQVDAYSYTAWCYDFQAESVRGKVNEFNAAIRAKETRIDELKERIENGQETIAEAADRIQQAEKQLADLRQSLTGSSIREKAPEDAPADERGGETLDEEVREKQRDLDAVNASKRQQRERQNLWNQLQGAKLDFEQRIEQAEAKLTANRDRLQDLQNKLAEARQRARQLDDQIEQLTDELRSKSLAIQTARQSRAALEEKLAELEEDLTQVKERTDARERDVRERARRHEAVLNEKIAALREQLQTAQKREEDVASEEDIAQRKQMQERLNGLQKERGELAESIADLERQEKKLQGERAINQAGQSAFRAALELNKQKRQRFNAESEEEKAEAQKTIAESLPRVLQKLRDWTNSITKLQVQIQGWAQNDIASAENNIEDIKAEIADIDQQKAPVQDKLEEWKRRAAAEFEKFLTEYPDNPTHSANNMSRLGGIYLELNEFDKAVTWLEKLRQRFPQSDAGQNALFDLGRALYENEQQARAAETFAKAASAPKAQRSTNLRYIARTMLEAGAARPALEAAEELIRRSTDEDHKDYSNLQGRPRQTALFRAGSAAVQLEEYRKAEKYISDLLEENDNTAYYFDAMFVRAEAYLKQTPPNYEAALKDLGQVSLHAEDPLLINKASFRLGRAYELRNQQKDLRRALSFYQQIVELADADVEGVREYVEKAIVRSAQVYTKQGNAQGQEAMLEKYQSLFPNGEFADELRALPVVKSDSDETSS